MGCVIVVHAMAFVLFHAAAGGHVVGIVIEFPVGSVLVSEVHVPLSGLEGEFDASHSFQVAWSQRGRVVVGIVELLEQPLRLYVVGIHQWLEDFLNQIDAFGVAAFVGTLPGERVACDGEPLLVGFRPRFWFLSSGPREAKKWQHETDR